MGRKSASSRPCSIKSKRRGSCLGTGGFCEPANTLGITSQDLEHTDATRASSASIAIDLSDSKHRAIVDAGP